MSFEFGKFLIDSLDMLSGVSVKNISDIRLWMLHRYETAYGIYNHDADNSNSTMPLVRQHLSEDPYYKGLLSERMREFLDSGVLKYFGENWSSFIQRPHEECLLMMEIANKYKGDANAKMANLMSDLEGDK